MKDGHQLNKWSGRADIEGRVVRGKALAKDAKVWSKDHSDLHMKQPFKQKVNNTVTLEELQGVAAEIENESEQGPI